MKERQGWVCPKCGAPNSPDNKTCAACFASNLDSDYNRTTPQYEINYDVNKDCRILLNEELK